MAMKTLFTLLLLFGISAATFAQKNNTVYKTTADGTWTGANWSPSVPPADLKNCTIIIEHNIEYNTNTRILNWNVSNAQITIEQTGSLTIKTNDSPLIQGKNFDLINNGKLTVDAGMSSFTIEKGATFVNRGKVKIHAGIIDVEKDVFAALYSNPTPNTTVEAKPK